MSGPTPRPGILDIAPYIPGDSSIPGRARVIKLSSNEGALGPSPAAMRALAGTAADIHRYPDGGAVALCGAIGTAHGLDPGRIVCGAGSDELITLLARGYAGPGDEVLTHAHAFVMYRLAGLSVGAEVVEAPERNLTADVDALLAAVTPRTRIVFIANPNNPTGTYVPLEEIERLRAGLPEDVVLVIDSAYAEYVTRNDYSAGESLVDRGQNTVMTRTFSKIYGLGGVRLGWAYCPESVASVLHRIRSPFNINAPAQAAGIAAVQDTDFLARSRDHNAAWLPWISERIAAAGFPVTPSVGNFVLVEFPAEEGRNAAAALAHLARHGLIPRAVAGNRLPNHLRITVGLEDEMRALVEAIETFPD
ncbi:MAG: histidinol-phosphate transaminase [Defluviicoccus sp.]|nr:histidinol-phosphate transaminase [Defluviicoccus sp.]MDE0383764.1 histidinol-phosphate transaminase [Defluviicoccus sp.]